MNKINHVNFLTYNDELGLKDDFYSLSFVYEYSMNARIRALLVYKPEYYE